MTSTGKIAIGLGLASSALLAVWLLTGNRKEKTKFFVSQKAGQVKNTLTQQANRKLVNDEACYI